MDPGRADTARFSTARRRPLLIELARLAVIVLGYFIAGKLGLQMAFANQSASPVWPPTGIALAVVLLLGYRTWPGLFIGAFLVNVTTTGSVPGSLGIATGNTLEAVVGAALANRFAGGRRAFEDARDIFRYIVLAAIPSTALSATIGVSSLALAGFLAQSTGPATWVTWWLGNMVSAVLLAPLILIWCGSPFPGWDRKALTEALAMLVVLSLSAVLVFGGLLPARFSSGVMPFMAFPPLLWVAYRFGPRGAATSVLYVASIALWGTLQGRGPLVLRHANDSLLVLQAFVGTIIMTNLVLGAAVSKERRVEKALRQSERALQRQVVEIENLYRTAPVGLCLLDREFRYLRINERLASFHGRPVAEHQDRTVRELVPDLADALEPIFRQVLEGRPCLDQEISGTTPAEPGVERHWLASYYPVREAGGAPTGISVVVQDITDRKRAEADLLAWQRELEARVERRTADLSRSRQELQAQIDERRLLEAQIARAIEREQIRLGSELHDGLGQQLAGVGLLLTGLREKLRDLSPERARDARQLQALVEKSIRETRDLARRLYPVELEGLGLLPTLRNLARSIELTYGVTCAVRSDGSRCAELKGPAAVQLFRIVQEAVHNAVKHGKARRLEIDLATLGDTIRLTVSDDGVGLPGDLDSMQGMGVHIMRYRARMAGGHLEVRNDARGGAVVTCEVPAEAWAASPGSDGRESQTT